MIVIVGESASGKSTLTNNFIKSNPEYRRIVTYTTRPMRKGEENGVDYNFISQNTFNAFVENDFFIEHAEYRGWSYGTAKIDCEINNAVAVLTPAGLRALKRQGLNDIISIYLYVDRRSRLINILSRGDDVDEAYRRNLSDVGQFDAMADEVDYVIDNSGFHMNKQQVLLCMNEIIKKAKESKEE